MNSKNSYPEHSIQEYLKHKPAFFAFLRPLEVELFRRFLPLKKPVLDFGCGDGFFTKVAFADQNIIDTGIDVDSRVKLKAEKSGIYHNVVIFDGQTLPFPDHSFSTIISNCVLEHVVGLPFVLKEIHRVLKPNGVFLTSVVTDKWEKNLVGGKIFGNLYLNIFRKIQRHENMFSEKQWQESFIEAGFDIRESIPYLTPKQAYWVELMHYPSTISLLGKIIHMTGIFKKIKVDDKTPGEFFFYSLIKVS